MFNEKYINSRIVKNLIMRAFILAIISTYAQEASKQELKLWYKQPATKWAEAIPIGNGR